MALLTLQTLSAPSLTPSYGAVSASDTVAALDDRMFLHVKNAGGSPDTVTIVIPGNDQFGSAIPDPTVSVPATTGDRMIPLIPAMADPATGLITVTHSFTTTVTCALIRR
jgi:lysophospholipase L1-like esterase